MCAVCVYIYIYIYYSVPMLTVGRSVACLATVACVPATRSLSPKCAEKFPINTDGFSRPSESVPYIHCAATSGRYIVPPLIAATLCRH